MEKNITKVKILGLEYSISCKPEESEQVKEAARFFNQKLKEIRQNTNLDEGKAAIITGLNISNDYLKNLSSTNDVIKSKPEFERLTSEIKNHIKSLSKVDD